MRMLFFTKVVNYVFNPTKMWEKLEETHYGTFFRKLQEKLALVKIKEDEYFSKERSKRNRTMSLKKKKHSTTALGSFKNSASMRSHSTSKRKLEPSSSKRLGAMNV